MTALLTLLSPVLREPRAQGHAASPTGRSGATAVYDAARKHVLLFGGEAASASGQGVDYPDDLWAWNGNAWRRMDPPPGAARPPGREVPHLVYDAARQRVLMFGGRRRPDWLFDVWEWDGTRWHERRDTGLEHVLHAATFYDPRRRRAMMFGGGRNPGLPSRTLSEWDGRRWTARDSAGPEDVLVMAVAVSPHGDATLLARSGRPNPPPSTRSWIWNSTSWRQAEAGPDIPELQATASSPEGVLYIFQSWDRVIAEPVMHRRDVAGTWRVIPMTTSPGIRSSPAAAWDASRDRMVLFGGRTRDRQFLGDTWEFDGREWVKR